MNDISAFGTNEKTKEEWLDYFIKTINVDIDIFKEKQETMGLKTGPWIESYKQKYIEDIRIQFENIKVTGSYRIRYEKLWNSELYIKEIYVSEV